MTPTENLFIRACKTENPHKRVRSVYRRFYGAYDDQVTNSALVVILADLCDKYEPFKAADLLEKVNPRKAVFQGQPLMDWQTLVLNVLIYQLRFTTAKTIPGFRIPARFRKQEKPAVPQTIEDFVKLGYIFDISATSYSVFYKTTHISGAGMLNPVERLKKMHWRHRKSNMENNRISALSVAKRHYLENNK